MNKIKKLEKERCFEVELQLVEKMYKKELENLVPKIVHGIEGNFSSAFYSLVEEVVYKYHVGTLSTFKRSEAKNRLCEIGIILK